MEPVFRFTWIRESLSSLTSTRLPVLLCAFLTSSMAQVMAAPSVNLDQGRNGQASFPLDPVHWVNGNLNASQSHYLEGYAIPYRLIMTDLPTDGTEIVLTLGYDVTHGGKHALDFLTHYMCMDDPSHMTYFGHEPVSVQPLDGVPLIGSDPAGLNDTVTDATVILVPPGTGSVSYALDQPAAGFGDNLCDKFITITGGEFSSDSGPEFAYSDNDGVPQEADLAADQEEQLFTVRFKATSPTVVLAWGGHIASRYDWGVDPDDGTPYSAGALSGSPYHMRVIDWNLGNLGNQDRSLSAGAVISLEECDLLGPEIVCHNGSPYNFTVVTDASTFSWSVLAGPAPQYADASIIDTSPDGKTVTVETPGPNVGFFTLMVTVDAGLPSENICEYVVEVRANPECSISGEDGPVLANTTNIQYSAPPGMDSYFWSISGDATIGGPVDEATVSVDTGSTCSGAFTLTLEISKGVCISVCEKSVIVSDTTPPEVTCPGDITIECDESSDPSNTGTATASDDSGVDPTVTFSDSASLDDCGLGTITRTWTAEDACGNTSSCEQVITIVDLTDPVILVNPADATVECDNIPAAPEVTASDNCDADPQVGLREVDERDPLCGTGTITRTWTATDCAGNTDEWVQVLTVVDTTNPVLSGVPADATVECDNVPQPAVVTASDNCDTDPLVSFQETNAVDPDCGTGTITRTWTASDCSGNMDSLTQVLTVVDNTNPVLSANPADTTVECDAIPDPETLTATDNCDSAPAVSFEEDNQVNPDCGTGTITRTWTATDCSGNEDVWVQTLTVVDTTDPIILVNPADATVECDDIPTPPVVTAGDNCDVAPAVTFRQVDEIDPDCGTGTITRTWTATDCSGNMDSWVQILTVVDNTNPVLSVKPTDTSVECDNIPEPPVVTATDNCDSDPVVSFEESTELNTECGTGTITRKWTATDCSGNMDMWTQTLTVVDTTDPEVNCPDDITVECGDSVDPAVTGVATTSDNCGAESSVEYEDSTDIDGCGGTIMRTWTATDCSGNTSSCVQVITLVDTTDPVMAVPGDVEIECDQDATQVDTGTATATDNCDADPAIEFSDESVFDDCDYETITRTWTATDCAGNSASGVQVIAVVDTTPPAISAPPDVIYSCEDDPDFDTSPASLGVATAVDNCSDDPLTVDYVDEVIGDGPSEIRRTWFATDCSGNLGTSVQRITCVTGNEVTDSSLCIFDRDPENDFEQDFRLLFTPDVKHIPAYKISSTNPGQFFYNVFYLGEPGDEVNLEICIPYPFITHGASPVHAYDWVYLEECAGSVGFVPGDAFHVDKTQITLDDYLPDPACGTQVCLMDVSFTVPDSGFAYFNIHLDYGMKKTGNYSQDIDGNAFDLVTGEILVANNCEHIFSVAGSVEGMDSIYNLNDFKGGPGVAGNVVVSGSGKPVKGAVMVLQSHHERVQLTIETDEDGYYFIPYARQGRPAVYELWMITPSGKSVNRNVLLRTNSFSVEDFTIDGE
ncbi:HYR domain-containing protein [Puniceicoccales bacterium CK1056]|uniref:HYR domain-containing protein n=2 Tax=Oceanipulchritudo coccoides TaxID=2706888 RepID=A0A6B2M4T9_9BACT|nr:HYR domain-containing protein [Oceanipulchritudo coccoides]